MNTSGLDNSSVVVTEVRSVTVIVGTEQQARGFAAMLAVPERTTPPPCPLCGASHLLEQRCVPRLQPSRASQGRHMAAEQDTRFDGQP